MDRRLIAMALDGIDEELIALARRVLRGEVTHCPHGRPVSSLLGKKDLEKAKEEGISVLESPLTAYEICARLAEKGLPAK